MSSRNFLQLVLLISVLITIFPTIILTSGTGLLHHQSDRQTNNRTDIHRLTRRGDKSNFYNFRKENDNKFKHYTGAKLDGNLFNESLKDNQIENDEFQFPKLAKFTWPKNQYSGAGNEGGSNTFEIFVVEGDDEDWTKDSEQDWTNDPPDEDWEFNPKNPSNNGRGGKGDSNGWDDDDVDPFPPAKDDDEDDWDIGGWDDDFDEKDPTPENGGGNNGNGKGSGGGVKPWQSDEDDWQSEDDDAWPPAEPDDDIDDDEEGTFPEEDEEKDPWDKDDDWDEEAALDKSYSFSFDYGDQSRKEVSDKDGNVDGSYSYIDTDGKLRKVKYMAGKDNGYTQTETLVDLGNKGTLGSKSKGKKGGKKGDQVKGSSTSSSKGSKGKGSGKKGSGFERSENKVISTQAPPTSSRGETFKFDKDRRQPKFVVRVRRPSIRNKSENSNPGDQRKSGSGGNGRGGGGFESERIGGSRGINSRKGTSKGKKSQSGTVAKAEAWTGVYNNVNIGSVPSSNKAFSNININNNDNNYNPPATTTNVRSSKSGSSKKGRIPKDKLSSSVAPSTSVSATGSTSSSRSGSGRESGKSQTKRRKKGKGRPPQTEEDWIYSRAVDGRRKRRKDRGRHRVNPSYSELRAEDKEETAAPPKNAAYSFAYKTGEAKRQERSDSRGTVMGSYSYIDDTGVKRTVKYTAGADTGFKILNTQPSFLSPVYAEAPPHLLRQSPAFFQSQRSFDPLLASSSILRNSPSANQAIYQNPQTLAQQQFLRSIAAAGYYNPIPIAAPSPFLSPEPSSLFYSQGGWRPWNNINSINRPNIWESVKLKPQSHSNKKSSSTANTAALTKRDRRNFRREPLFSAAAERSNRDYIIDYQDFPPSDNEYAYNFQPVRPSIFSPSLQHSPNYRFINYKQQQQPVTDEDYFPRSRNPIVFKRDYLLKMSPYQRKKYLYLMKMMNKKRGISQSQYNYNYRSSPANVFNRKRIDYSSYEQAVSDEERPDYYDFVDSRSRSEESEEDDTTVEEMEAERERDRDPPPPPQSQQNMVMINRNTLQERRRMMVLQQQQQQEQQQEMMMNNAEMNNNNNKISGMQMVEVRPSSLENMITRSTMLPEIPTSIPSPSYMPTTTTTPQPVNQPPTPKILMKKHLLGKRRKVSQTPQVTGESQAQAQAQIGLERDNHHGQMGQQQERQGSIIQERRRTTIKMHPRDRDMLLGKNSSTTNSGEYPPGMFANQNQNQMMPEHQNQFHHNQIISNTNLGGGRSKVKKVIIKLPQEHTMQTYKGGYGNEHPLLIMTSHDSKTIIPMMKSNNEPIESTTMITSTTTPTTTTTSTTTMMPITLSTPTENTRTTISGAGLLKERMMGLAGERRQSSMQDNKEEEDMPDVVVLPRMRGGHFHPTMPSRMDDSAGDSETNEENEEEEQDLSMFESTKLPPAPIIPIVSASNYHRGRSIIKMKQRVEVSTSTSSSMTSKTNSNGSPASLNSYDAYGNLITNSSSSNNANHNPNIISKIVERKQVLRSGSGNGILKHIHGAALQPSPTPFIQNQPKLLHSHSSHSTLPQPKLLPTSGYSSPIYYHQQHQHHHIQPTKQTILLGQPTYIPVQSSSISSVVDHRMSPNFNLNDYMTMEAGLRWKEYFENMKNHPNSELMETLS